MAASTATDVRAANRDYSYPTDRADNIGARCARDIWARSAAIERGRRAAEERRACDPAALELGRSTQAARSAQAPSPVGRRRPRAVEDSAERLDAALDVAGSLGTSLDVAGRLGTSLDVSARR
ncbi:hypothetical protein WME90_27925 [Sorangium sp. So ce375]|uniref:hypothetical protein n=1 Tax=Sorangium sp. So ce375 TaxID=3133306 RepID=UPI003F5CA102